MKTRDHVINSLPFITMEDITEQVESHNYVVFNFALPEEKRISEFVKIMKRRIKHRFTKSELNRLASYTHPCDAKKFIHDVQSMIYQSV